MKQLLITIAAVVLVGCGPSPPDISIHEAAEQGDIQALKKHLIAGTHVNESDDNGWTPLHIASHIEYEEMIELLIDKNANVNVKRKDGATPIDMARDMVIINLLQTNGGKHSTIHRAVASRNVQAIKDFLDSGIDVNAKNNDGETPLDVTDGDKEIIDLLRKLGGKNTTIHRAVAAGNFEEIKEFLTSGGNVNELSSSSKSTLLHLAVWNGHEKIVQYLLTKGADINPKNNLGFTPVDVVQPREPNIADLLRKHGGKTGEELKAEGK